MFAPQPLDDIAEYFGVKVALYFAWLGHYTCALCVPAVLGTILWAGLWGRGQTAQDIGHILFSLFNVTWASVYLEGMLYRKQIQTEQKIKRDFRGPF